MVTRVLVPLAVVLLAGYLLYSQYQRGAVALPGLPPATTATASATGTPTSSGGPAQPADPDPIRGLRPERAAVLEATRAGRYAEGVAAADAWLATRPTDALVALERNTALAALLRRPTLTIGLSAPISGPLRQVGEAFLQGVNMAVAEANAAGGVRGRRVVVRVYNDGADRALALTAASRLLADADVLGVVGPYSSSTTLAAADVYNEGLPIVAPAATSPRVTAAGPYVYRVAPSDTQQGASLARLVAARGLRSVAVLFDASDAYSKGLADAFRTEAARRGLAVRPQEVRLGAARAVTTSGADAVLVSGYTPDVAAVATALRGRDVPIFAGDGAYGQDLLGRGGEAVEGVVLTTFFHATSSDAGSRAFTRAFEARYGGGTPNANAAQAYDATRTLLEAIRRAPTLDRAGVRAGLESFRSRPGAGVTAPVRLDANGDVVGRPFVAIEVRNGRFRAIGLAP